MQTPLIEVHITTCMHSRELAWAHTPFRQWHGSNELEDDDNDDRKSDSFLYS